MAQSASDSLQSMPDGRLSSTTTPVALPGPRFSTLMDQVMTSPALTEPPSGVLVTVMSGQRTVILPGSVSVPSLFDVIWPVLFTTPHVALVVPLTRTTVPLTGAAFGKFGLPSIEPTLQASFSAPTAPLIAQVEPVPVELSMLQSSPAVVGRSSVTTTPVALPSPSFVQLSVKLIWSPAEAEPSFGVLTIWTSAGMTRTHSVVALVWEASRYLEPALGVYSARKQYQPMALGVNAVESASPLTSVMSLPVWVPPVEQAVALWVGPQ